MCVTLAAGRVCQLLGEYFLDLMSMSTLLCFFFPFTFSAIPPIPSLLYHHLISYLSRSSKMSSIVKKLWVLWLGKRPPKVAHPLVANATREYVSFMAQETLQMWLILRTLIQRDHPGLSRWVQSHHRHPWKQSTFSGWKKKPARFKAWEGLQAPLLLLRSRSHMHRLETELKEPGRACKGL